MKTALEFLRKAHNGGFLPRMSLGLAGRGSIAGLIILAAVFASSTPASAAGPFTVPDLARVAYTIPQSGFIPEFRATCLMRFEPSGLAWESGGEIVFQPGMCYVTDAPSPPPPPPPPYEPPWKDLVLVWDFDPNNGRLTLPQGLFCGEVEEGVLAFGIEFAAQLGKAGAAGSGTATLVTDATAPFDCADGLRTTGPLTLTPLSQTHDEDLDGCSDWAELGSDVTQGGLRDPFNMWDYMNPLMNDINRTGDTTAVVQHYGHDQGDALYGTLWDRAGTIPGANNWNLNPPDGIIRTADITAAVNSYGHDCTHLTSYTGIGKMHDAINSVSTGSYPLEALPVGAVPSVDWPNAFPTSGQAHLGDETITYTRSGSTFTITARGQGGTTATSHPAGTFVWVP